VPASAGADVFRIAFADVGEADFISGTGYKPGGRLRE